MATRLIDHIILIGPPGVGKTTLGRLIARELDMDFFDSDKLIAAQEALSISEIFPIKGEAFFRKLETNFLENFSNLKKPAVIATGGGTPLVPANVKFLQKLGAVIFIDDDPQRIAKRISTSGGRPLVKSENDFYDLYNQRLTTYEAVADKRVVLDEDITISQGLLLDAVRAYTLDCDFAVIGDPISHSLSPDLHRLTSVLSGHNYTYHKIHVTKKELSSFIDRVRSSKLLGFNLTAPLKRAVLPLLDELGDEAAAIGSVNTVLAAEGKLVGHNTDSRGLRLALMAEGLAASPQSVVILGDGGASLAACCAARTLGASSVVRLARQPKYEDVLRWDFSSPHTIFSSADIIINATPLGMGIESENFTDWKFLEDIPKNSLVCDLIYKPNRTKLLVEAQKLGLRTMNGLTTLIYQGLLAARLFLKEKSDEDFLASFDIKAIKNELEKI